MAALSLGGTPTAAAGLGGLRTPGSPEPTLRTVERIVGSADAEDELPLVIILHGRGDRAETFLKRFASLRARARVVAIEAPQPDPSGRGFAWLGRTVRTAPDDEVARELMAVAGRVAGQVEVVVAARPTTGSPILVGYSQGGMVALAVAAQSPDLVGEVITAGSYLPVVLAPGVSGGHHPRVRMVHARSDAKMPHARARATVRGFRGAQWDARLQTIRSGHHRLGSMWQPLVRELRRAVAFAGADGTGGG